MRKLRNAVPLLLFACVALIPLQVISSIAAAATVTVQATPSPPPPQLPAEIPSLSTTPSPSITTKIKRRLRLPNIPVEKTPTTIPTTTTTTISTTTTMSAVTTSSTFQAVEAKASQLVSHISDDNLNHIVLSTTRVTTVPAAATAIPSIATTQTLVPSSTATSSPIAWTEIATVGPSANESSVLLLKLLSSEKSVITSVSTTKVPIVILTTEAAMVTTTTATTITTTTATTTTTTTTTTTSIVTSANVPTPSTSIAIEVQDKLTYLTTDETQNVPADLPQKRTKDKLQQSRKKDDGDDNDNDDYDLGGFQRDAMWVDDPKAAPSRPVEYDPPFVQKKSQDGAAEIKRGMLMVVVRPKKYTADTMIHLRYNRVNDDPSSEYQAGKESMSSSMSSMPWPAANISFPLEKEKAGQEGQEVQLVDLAQGWYVVCAEAVRNNVTLQKDCFTANVFCSSAADVDDCRRTAGTEAAGTHSGALSGGAVAAIAVVCSGVALVLVLVIAVHFKVHKRRRKRIDRELQERVARKAQQERDRQEKENANFKDVYIDPDEPYQERCIM